MKHLLCGLLSLFFFAARAQSGAQPTRDGLAWTDGQLVLLQNGVARPVGREVRLPSGARVLPSGRVIMANGRQGQLRPGDGVDPKTGAWFARRAQNPDGTTFLPLPVRLELPAESLGKVSSNGTSTTNRRYHYEQKRQRDKNGRRLPDEEEDDDDDD
ncbi:DUF6799 domain-containing protein [Hymenobacter persicinus]|uniref:DUF6799 domain-containing protein n=1 Tax=Hymenobacter persicinus TaxID=2025506 RepID=A0A4Q5LBW0_9BACT|nr:DUF6799 domain-containing protein [Hymenobacter persicinus]RYU78610.1 hypothetical protein EWM57_13275 [Hymenobacter persicinus]